MGPPKAKAFLGAVSHSLGTRVPCDVMNQSDSDNNDDADDVPTASGNGNGAPSAAVQPPDLCEVCMVEERDAHHALEPCGHQRFCASCAARMEAEARGGFYSSIVDVYATLHFLTHSLTVGL